jgi:hypothetical protein
MAQSNAAHLTPPPKMNANAKERSAQLAPPPKIFSRRGARAQRNQLKIPSVAEIEFDLVLVAAELL